MKSEILKQKEAVEKLFGRGKNVLVIGPTGVGKTHLTNSIFPSILKTYLSIREGEGLATIKTTVIVLSDYINLNDDELIITGRISHIDKYDRNVISECEKLLLDIVYEPIKTIEKQITKTGDIVSACEKFRELVDIQIDNLRMYNDNTKLSYKLKSVENYDSILKSNIFNDEIDLSEMVKTLLDIYRRSKALVNGEDIKRVFIDEITSKASIYVPSDSEKQTDSKSLDLTKYCKKNNIYSIQLQYKKQGG